MKPMNITSWNDMIWNICHCDCDILLIQSDWMKAILRHFPHCTPVTTGDVISIAKFSAMAYAECQVAKYSRGIIEKNSFRTRENWILQNINLRYLNSMSFQTCEDSFLIMLKLNN